MKKLSDDAARVYSQHGEDGIIARIFETIGVSSRVCIEFGAWDGLFFSNTAHLWKNGWKAILIEADQERYRELVQNTTGYDCYCINAHVCDEGDGMLENILKAHHLPLEADFLSIDIDGDDYFILASLQRLRPRVIACECNRTLPAHGGGAPRKGGFFGSSPQSLARLAATKGYRFVAMTDTNCFFVTDRDGPKFSGYDTSLEPLATGKRIRYLARGYARWLVHKLRKTCPGRSG